LPFVFVLVVLNRWMNDFQSAGAACHSEDVTVSHVLAGMGVTVDDALCTVRLSVGRYSTPENIREAANVMIHAGKLIRKVETEEEEDGDGHDECSIVDAKDVRLTSTTHGLGCGCKIGMIQLEKILSQIPIKKNANVLVGTSTSDDAGVYKITDEIAIVQTVDFFTPICDDPIEFGEIAAANAMSDVYAMGGVPICALNLVAFPVQRLPLAVMRDILLGAQKKADEAGCMIVGGHTIEDSEPKFGMCVTGIIHPEKIWRNIGARDGDVLLLTKPIGLGILTTAMKRKMCTDQAKEEAIKTMSQLNRSAMEAFLHFDVHACTDVTGFGLLGHLLEMLRGTSMRCTVHSNMVPLLKEVEELAVAGIIPGGTQNNVKYVESFCEYDDAIPPHLRVILNDAQTSGGLMVAISKEHMEEALDRCKSMGVDVWYIGDFDETSSIVKDKSLHVVE
jgi:cysteine desulfurase